MSYFTQFRGLPRQVYCISITRTIIGIGSMVFMFFSLLMTRMLGFTEFQAGLAFLVMALSNVAGAIVGGKLADRYGRKRVFMACITTASIIYALTSTVAGTRAMIPFLYLSSMAGSATYPISSAMVADSAPEEQRTECFSLLYLAHNLGFAFGPSIGGLLFYDHMGLLFIVQAVIFMGGGLFLFFTTTDVYTLGVGKEFGVPEQAADVMHREAGSRQNTLRLLLTIRPLLVFIVALVLLTMCYQMTGFMLPLQMADLFGMRAASRYSGFTWTVNALCVVLGTPFIIGYTKKHHQLESSAFATLLYALGFGLYSFIKAVPLFYVAVVIWTAGEIMISTGAGVFIAAHAPATHRARFQSLYDMSRSLGRGLGPPLFGWMLTRMDYAGAWIINGFVCLVVGALLYGSYRRDLRAPLPFREG